MAERVAFVTDPNVRRMFIACEHCRRVMPHYHVYGRLSEKSTCRCGCNSFRPVRIPEWRAAWWVLVVGWLWRKTIRRHAEWDPRMPMRTIA
jgi:hypothetical protein